MEETGTLVQKQEPSSSQSNITIKLTGDANDLSEIVNDINSQYYLKTQSDDQTSVKTQISPNSESLKKKLRMKEEVLPQRVILVVPKNSPSHYLSSPQYQNESICVENSKRNFTTNLQFEDLKIKNNQQNNKLCTQNIFDNKTENNLLMYKDKDTNPKYTKSPNLDVTHNETVTNTISKSSLDFIDQTKKLDNMHKAEIRNLKQIINSHYSSKQLNEKKFQSLESAFKNHKAKIIKHTKLESPIINEKIITDYSLYGNSRPLKRKLNITDNIINFNTSTQILNNLQGNNPAQDMYLLNGSAPLKKLHSPIVLRRCHPINHFKQNKFLNTEQKTTSNTDSINDKTIENKTSPSVSLDNLTETTNCSTAIEVATQNQLSKNIRTYSSLVHKRNQNLNSNSFKKYKTTKLSLPENKRVTTGDQETSQRNAKMDISLHKYSLNLNISQSNTKLMPEIRQRVNSLGITDSITIQPVLDNNEKKLSLESNNYKCTKSSEPPEKKMYFESLGLNKISHDDFHKNQHIKSPQIKVNGLMIRAPDPNLLNNSALKEKIQEFRLSNTPSGNVSSLSEKNAQNKCTEQRNNSITLPEVSESLVSTTTVESGQLDKKMKDCQCNRLRQEVDEQWKIISHLRLRINNLPNESNYEYDSFVREKSPSVEEEHISSMLVQKLEDANKKITEDLRKEQIRSNKLRLTIKHKNSRIRQLENRLRKVSRICEDTEKNAIYLRKLLNSSSEVRDSILAQNDLIFNL